MIRRISSIFVKFWREAVERWRDFLEPLAPGYGLDWSTLRATFFAVGDAPAGGQAYPPIEGVDLKRLRTVEEKFDFGPLPGEIVLTPLPNVDATFWLGVAGEPDPAGYTRMRADGSPEALEAMPRRLEGKSKLTVRYSVQRSDIGELTERRFSPEEIAWLGRAPAATEFEVDPAVRGLPIPVRWQGFGEPSHPAETRIEYREGEAPRVRPWGDENDKTWR